MGGTLWRICNGYGVTARGVAKLLTMSSNEPKSDSMAGGAPLAISILGGAGIGIAMGQPMIGAVAGTAVGVAIALAIYLTDKKRRG